MNIGQNCVNGNLLQESERILWEFLENFEISLLCVSALMPGSFAVTNCGLNFHICFFSPSMQ